MSMLIYGTLAVIVGVMIPFVWMTKGFNPGFRDHSRNISYLPWQLTLEWILSLLEIMHIIFAIWNRQKMAASTKSKASWILVGCVFTLADLIIASDNLTLGYQLCVFLFNII